MQIRLREPVNGLTHLAGALLALWGLIYLWPIATTVHQKVSAAIFGSSMILLYCSSTLYHLVPGPAHITALLRKIDHSMIFVLIAGSYTPFCLIALQNSIGVALLTAVWGLAILGILLKVFWRRMPRGFSISFYMAMGLTSIVGLPEIYAAAPPKVFFWLLTGGAFYFIGTLIYATKWPDPIPRYLGFHEIWHLFVLGGSICTFLAAKILIAS